MLTKSGNKLIDNGNLSKEDYETIFALVKDDSLNTFERRIPPYLGHFIRQFNDETLGNSGKSLENQLTERYFDYLLQLNSPFITEWYQFEIDVTNILTASSCKKYQLPVEPELIGFGELNEKLIRSSARDFGIGNDFPKLEMILRAIEESDIMEREKKIDLIKWELLDERTFFHYFTIEKIFAYILKLDIIERWINLDKKTGEELFNRLLNDLESSQNFSEEFDQK